MSYDPRRPRARGRAFPSPAPPSSHNRQHSVLGYWVPLVVTGTLALGGLAAWVWSERNEHDDDDDHHAYPRPPSDQKPPPRPPPEVGQHPYPPTQGGQSYPGGRGGGIPPYSGPIPSQSSGPQGQPPPGPPPPDGEAASYYAASAATMGPGSRDAAASGTGGGGWMGQVRGAMRRTPSPQQFFDSATKQVSAGFAAAGSALGRIIEEQNGTGSTGHAYGGEEGFSDHERWSEEAGGGAVEEESERRVETARTTAQGRGGQARKTVAVVVSADVNMDGKLDEEDGVFVEHASILSHLLPVHDPATTDLFILIYAPGLTRQPPLTWRPVPPNTTTTATNDDAASMADSSYSHIPTPAATTPGSELPSISPQINPTTTISSSSDPIFTSPSPSFTSLYSTSLPLVPNPSHILPFTTATGYIPLLRHLAPQIVYVSDVLAGARGSAVAQLRGWVGHTVLVVGDRGTGGLADTETEGEEGGEEWWEKSGLVGLGKEVEVVDAGRVGEDWGRRVVGRG